MLLCSRALFNHSKCNSSHLWTPNSQSSPPPPLPLGTHSLLSVSVSLFLFGRWAHLCHILDFTYKWYCAVFVFVWLTSLSWESLAASMWLQMALLCSFSWLSSILLYIVSNLLYPFICPWTFSLFTHLGYCEQCCSEHRGVRIFFNYSFIWVYSQEWDHWIICDPTQ